MARDSTFVIPFSFGEDESTMSSSLIDSNFGTVRIFAWHLFIFMILSPSSRMVSPIDNPTLLQGSLIAFCNGVDGWVQENSIVSHSFSKWANCITLTGFYGSYYGSYDGHVRKKKKVVWSKLATCQLPQHHFDQTFWKFIYFFISEKQCSLPIIEIPLKYITILCKFVFGKFNWIILIGEIVHDDKYYEPVMAIQGTLALIEW